MSGRDDMDWKDEVDIVLRGPDGKVKDRTTSRKPNLLVIVLAIVFFIPVTIYNILFKKG